MPPARPRRRIFHLEFDRVFPDDVYSQMLDLMPQAEDYRPIHGRSKGHDLADGTHTRVKIDLFPEYIRNLPPAKKALGNLVGHALTSGRSSRPSCASWRRACRSASAPNSPRSACIRSRSQSRS
jgi:hypothetical protein